MANLISQEGSRVSNFFDWRQDEYTPMLWASRIAFGIAFVFVLAGLFKAINIFGAVSVTRDSPILLSPIGYFVGFWVFALVGLLIHVPLELQKKWTHVIGKIEKQEHKIKTLEKQIAELKR